MSQTKASVKEATAYAKSWILKNDMGKAFKAAFPKSKANKASIYTKASKLHKTVEIQSRILEMQESSKKATEEEFNISTSDLKKMLKNAAIMGLKPKIDAQGNRVAHSIPGAVSAISEINKMDGNHAPAKQDLTSSDGTMSPRNFNDFYNEK